MTIYLCLILINRREQVLVKVVISHPAQQHSYLLAAAMEEKNIDYKYITTSYYKKNTFTKLITDKVLKGDSKTRALSRCSKHINSNNVLVFCEYLNLVLLLLQRLDRKKRLYNKLKEHLNRVFAKKLAKYLIENNVEKVVVFDQYYNYLMDYLGIHISNLEIILDMSAPNYSYMTKEFKDNLPCYMESELDKNLGYNGDRELVNANKILVASDYTIKSIVETCNVNTANIFKCVYGLDFFKDKCKKTENNLNVLFIGRLNKKKGFHIFNDLAHNYLDNDRVKFTAIGSKFNDGIELSGNISLTGHIPRKMVENYLSDADILIMPSVSDGFGKVVLEAMSYGVAVICSANTGASDLITDGENGYIFDIKDDSSLRCCFSEIVNNSDLLDTLKKNSLISSKKFTVNNYYNAVSKAILCEI